MAGFGLGREFRDLSTPARNMHERWLEDWTTDRDTKRRHVVERDYEYNSHHADNWRVKSTRQRVFSSWLSMARLAWKDERKALGFWRLNSIRRFIGLWTSHVKRKHKNIGDNYIVIREKRESLIITANARVLVLRCQWALLRWKQYARSRRHLRLTRAKLMIGLAVKKWKDYTLQYRTKRRLYLLSIGLRRNRELRKALERWKQSVGDTKQYNYAHTCLSVTKARLAVNTWKQRVKSRKDRIRWERVNERLGVAYWYRKRIAITLDFWYRVLVSRVERRRMQERKESVHPDPPKNPKGALQ
ncbi:hypothetical protein AAMO2058_000081000 [Amorphochlora amoebiformis]